MAQIVKPLVWTPSLELGVEMMDRHHRQIVALSGAFLQHRPRRGSAEAAEILLEWVDFTAMHFEAEEELMRRVSYPGRVDHQDRHHELARALKIWELRAKQGNLRFDPVFFQQINLWVENHILGSDRGFSRYLLARTSPMDSREWFTISGPKDDRSALTCFA